MSLLEKESKQWAVYRRYFPFFLLSSLSYFVSKTPMGVPLTPDMQAIKLKGKHISCYMSEALLYYIMCLHISAFNAYLGLSVHTI